LTNGRKVNTYPVPLMALDPGLSLKERSLPIPKKVLPVSVEGVPEAAARRLIRGSLVVRVWAIGHPASGQTCPLALRRVTARSRTSRIGVAAWAGATDAYDAFHDNHLLSWVPASPFGPTAHDLAMATSRE
jgi:hypothetical protein